MTTTYPESFKMTVKNTYMSCLDARTKWPSKTG